MSTIEELYDELEKYSNFDVDGNAEKFLDTVGEIIKHKDPSSIGILLNYFDDETEYSWVFQSIIQGLESYPVEAYVRVILNKINCTIKKSPEWFLRLINRLLNDDKSKEIFSKNIRISPKEDLLCLFQIIDREYPHHKNFIDGLRREIETE